VQCALCKCARVKRCRHGLILAVVAAGRAGLGGLWRHRLGLGSSWLLLPRNARRPISACACQRRQTDDSQPTCGTVGLLTTGNVPALVLWLRGRHRNWNHELPSTEKFQRRASVRRGGEQLYEFCRSYCDGRPPAVDSRPSSCGCPPCPVTWPTALAGCRPSENNCVEMTDRDRRVTADYVARWAALVVEWRVFRSPAN